MLITIVSECHKKALPRTRQVLDSFSERIGSRTWQTIITQKGVEALHKELGKTASRSTAVACHWHRSRTRSELLWTVGRKGVFDLEGRVAVNTTSQEREEQSKSERWEYLPLIKELAVFSALFHDWGKCNSAFQKKLKSSGGSKDIHRHEWLSVLFLRAFYDASGEELWLERMLQGDLQEKKVRETLKTYALEAPFDNVECPTLLSVMWLILSHHRMPYKEGIDPTDEIEDLPSLLESIKVSWQYQNEEIENLEKDPTYKFSRELLSNSCEWMTAVKKSAYRLRRQMHTLQRSFEEGAIRSVLTHARLCLMLADHNYSSRPEDPHYSSSDTSEGNNFVSSLQLYANTKKKQEGNKRELDQHLDGHLLHVSVLAGRIAQKLPEIELDLPELQGVSFPRSPDPQFAWQDAVLEKIRRTAKKVNLHKTGFFGVNLASTGYGKTIANAKIMNELGARSSMGTYPERGVRFTVGLGLRTLTHQTGQEFESLLGLSSEELAVITGASAIAEITESANGESSQKTPDPELTFSESRSSLLNHEKVLYEGKLSEQDLAQEEVFTTLFDAAPKYRKLLHAPLLVCTIDHLMQATESLRGGRHILPQLRLLSSDLVIDEVDDFSGNDEVAIARLVHLVGMLGRRVLLSSATIPPAMATGLYHAYQSGWKIYAQTKHEVSPEVQCLWVDEFGATLKGITGSDQLYEQYQTLHKKFAQKRMANLQQQPVKRTANLVQVELPSAEVSKKFSENTTTRQRYYEAILRDCLRKHEDHHSTHSESSRTVSLGVVRIAHIKQAVAVTRYFLDASLPEETTIRVMTYHSNQVDLLRARQEQYLNAVLNRKKDPDAPLQDSVISDHLAALSPEVRKVLFIVIATPVEEVGRDHDFDWAVIEPSSYRSFIQMAGRVRRHRSGEINAHNVGIMQYNLKAFLSGDQAGSRYFEKPGYETSSKLCLPTHNLYECLDARAVGSRLDAQPRMDADVHPPQSLIGVEHRSIEKRLCSYQKKDYKRLEGYLNAPWWLTGQSQRSTPFRESAPTRTFVRIYDAEKEVLFFSEKVQGKVGYEQHDLRKPVSAGDFFDLEAFSELALSRMWLDRSYVSLLIELTREKYPEFAQLGEGEQRDLLFKVAQRYGELTFTYYEDQPPKFYHDQLGTYSS